LQPAKSRIRYPTDGLKVYLEAVEGSFGAHIDYAVIHKVHKSSQEEIRYSPAKCVGCERKTAMGEPNPFHISASYVERQSPTMRMGMRGFARLERSSSR
jgi:hypothetical protein